MYKISLAFLLILSNIVLFSCKKSIKEPEITPKEVHITPLHYYFSKRDSSSVLADSLLVKRFLQIVGYETEEPLSVQASRWANSLQVDIFSPEVERVFGSDFSPLENKIGYFLGAAEAYGLKIPEYRYATIVYGKNKSIVESDSIFMIALNHYLGDDYEGYLSFPVYERTTKTPEQLPYDIVEAVVSSTYPFKPDKDSGENVLQNLLYSGAIVSARKDFVENSTDAEALGLNEKQYQWLLENEKNLWNELIRKQLLFDKDPLTIHKLFDPSPTTSILSIYSPGRVGRFLGYRIIRDYMEKNPDITFSDILSHDFYNDPNILQRINPGF